jgi:hypothetical protein
MSGQGPPSTPTQPTASAAAPATRTTTTCISDPDWCNPPPEPARAVWPHCEEWHDLAAAVGWPEEQGHILSHVLWRESRCNPDAYNRQSCGHGDHAIGLMQLCGWGGGELYNPTVNLSKGLWLWERSGWRPWCLPGDPVTGRC